MDTNNNNFLPEEQVDSTPSAEVAEIETVEAATDVSVIQGPVFEPAVTQKEKKAVTRAWDNLLSALLLVMMISLTGVLYYLIVENFQQGAIALPLANCLINSIFIFMGLGIFFATRTGSGKNVYRVNLFSIVLILLPLLVLYVSYVLVVFETMTSGFLYNILEWVMGKASISFNLSLVLFGYVLPYSFISGYERRYDDPAANDVVAIADAEAPVAEVAAEVVAEEIPEESVDVAVEAAAEETVSAPSVADISETVSL